ncbi:MAG: carbohydrate ABC transporter permease [Chloroflexota bacterium]|nr:carbohydrate ABC transporter permease [Chloroflexota bacterium]
METEHLRRRDYDLILNVILIVITTIMIIPWLIALSTALKAPGESLTNPSLIPQQIDLGKFVEVFQLANVPVLALNSIIVTGATVIIVLFLASLAAYGFARIDFIFREPLFFLLLTGMMLQSAALIVPLYQVNVALNLLNTRTALIGPYVALGLPFAVLILRGFFESLPKELEEAAIVDGATRFTVYWRVLLPLTRPALATVGIFIGLSSWNDFLLPMLFVTKSELNTLPQGLLVFQFDNIVQQEHRFALIVMMMTPVVIVFLLLQRQFMQGLTAGAVKG